MKYAVFAIAMMGVPPLAFIISLNRSWMKYAIWAMIAALAAYQATAINFFSNEWYRGTSRGMEVSVIYLFAAAMLITAAIKRRLPKLVPSVGAALFVVYFLLCLPSWSTAESKLFAWMEIWKMIMLYMTYLSVRAYLGLTDDVKALMKGLAVFAVFNFLLIVKDHFSGVYQPHGVFPHACIVRTYSRGALAMIPPSFAVTFALMLFAGLDVPKRRVFMRILPIAAVGFIGLAAMLPRIIERFESAPEASKNTRLELALCAKEMIDDEPWRGVGINNWGIKINPPYEYAERAGRNTNRDEEFRDGIVETVYLLVGAECGIPALAAMLVWFFYYLLIACRLVKKLKGTPYAAIPAGLAGGLVACYLQSCLEWVLRQQMNLILLMIFFAVLDHLNKNAARIAAEARGGGHA